MCVCVCVCVEAGEGGGHGLSGILPLYLDSQIDSKPLCLLSVCQAWSMCRGLCVSCCQCVRPDLGAPFALQLIIFMLFLSFPPACPAAHPDMAQLPLYVTGESYAGRTFCITVSLGLLKIVSYVMIRERRACAEPLIWVQPSAFYL